MNFADTFVAEHKDYCRISSLTFVKVTFVKGAISSPETVATDVWLLADRGSYEPRSVIHQWWAGKSWHEKVAMENVPEWIHMWDKGAKVHKVCNWCSRDVGMCQCKETILGGVDL